MIQILFVLNLKMAAMTSVCSVFLLNGLGPVAY